VRGLQERRTVASLRAAGARIPRPVGGDGITLPRPSRRLGSVAVVALPVLVADQISKAWALSSLSDGPVVLVGPLRLNLTYNSAAAFGLGGGLVPFLALLAAVVVVGCVLRGAAAAGTARAVAFGALLGGALGNIVDRLVRGEGFLQGAVIDFIDVGYWPVFNLADTAITLACITLVLLTARSDPAGDQVVPEQQPVFEPHLVTEVTPTDAP